VVHLENKLKKLFKFNKKLYICLSINTIKYEQLFSICKDNEQAFPDKGFCASQSMYYYGYKLHATCSVTGVFKSFDMKKKNKMCIFSFFVKIAKCKIE